MKKIAYIYNMLDMCWNIKQMMKQLGFISLFIIMFSILMKELFPLVTLLIVFSVILIQFTHSWFKIIKPTIAEVNKEIEIESKYQFMLRRFNS